MITIAALLVAALGAVAPAHAAADASRWKHLAPGLEFRMMDGGASCRRGSPRVAVTRIDTRRWRVEPFTCAEDPKAGGPLDIEAWRLRTGAAVVFNAGQYYPDHVPMGLFVKEGRNLGSRQIKSWKGILVAEPKQSVRGRGLARAAILDLEHDKFTLSSNPWRIAVQSFMLLDRDAKKRVRRSDWLANRTVVATDRRGRLLAIHTEGGWSLWDLADWIARSDLGVRQAMSMDGGYESQISLRAGEFAYLSYGQWHIDDRGDHSVPGLRVRLPAVIAVFVRK